MSTVYRYYTLHRPPMLGGVPIENLVGCEMYMKPVQSENGNVWGYVDYTEPLSDDVIADCELVYEPKIEEQEEQSSSSPTNRSMEQEGHHGAD